MEVTRFTVEEIDRAVYNRLRESAVAFGNLPDVLLYQTDPSGYAAARQSKGRGLVDVFGVGAADSKGEKTVNRIVVSRQRRSFGEIGGWPAKELVVTSPTTWLSRDLPDTTVNFEYYIRSITNSAEYDRVLFDIIYRAFGTRRVVYSYSPDLQQRSEKYFLGVLEDDLLLSDDDYKERLYRFRIYDIWLDSGAWEEEGRVVVPLTTVSVPFPDGGPESIFTI